tara:strand:- start:959 stop:1159 length:201 start_codon:yes stop_codon:yes gene_type:complete
MKLEEIQKLKKGDKIKINTYHLREGRLKTTRIIKEIYEHPAGNKICVRCFGWDRFELKPNEILEKL